MTREEFLKQENRTEKDVMRDDGGEYIVTDSLEGEMEDGKMTEFSKGRKWYLPEEFQSE